MGRFADSLEANVDAREVDEACLAEAGEAVSGFYRYGLYPHNVGC